MATSDQSSVRGRWGSKVKSQTYAVTPFNGFNVPFSTNILSLDNMTKNGKV